MIILSILFISFIGLILYSKKFNNPFKLTFIFGKKGSGKSCLMIHDMIRDLKKGWTVYTDIPDINIPGVRSFNAHDLSEFAPAEAKSAIYIDEVGILFDNRNFKSFPPGLRDFFKLQRKYHCKVVMNSQSFDVDKKIRDCTDRMILQTNILNIISISRPILRSVTLVEASAQGESRIADNLKFANIFQWKFYWMPRYFKYFNSFSAPARQPLPYTELKKEIKSLSKSAKQALRDLEDD